MPFVDDDRDGFDDETGLTERQMAEREFRGGVGYIDRNGDGRDDTYGVTPEEYQRTVSARDEAERQAQRDANARAAYDRQYDEYDSSGQRREDLDAGRDPMGEEPREGDGEIPQWVKDTRGVPIVGGPADAWMAEYEARRRARGWEGLSDYMPSPDDLAVEYEQEGFIAGPDRSLAAGGDRYSTNQETRALDALADVYSSGGMTAADRARMQMGEMEVGRQMRASREADLAALQARGMGGSGAQIASMLNAQQAGADGLFARDAQMQAHAEDRALDAMRDAGGMASQMRGEAYREHSAADDLNRWNTDYARGREERNTRWRNQTRESRSEARQQDYENRERQQAGLTGQWSSAASGSRQDQERNDENAKGVLSSIAELFD